MIPVEDNFEDVIVKAMRGLNMGKRALAQQAGVSVATLSALLDGAVHTDALATLAPLLKLNTEALLTLAKHARTPEPATVNTLRCHNTHFPVPGYEEMTVNSYLVWDNDTKEAVAFDTGANVDAMLADIQDNGLTLKLILITHTHRDHIAALATLLQHTNAPATYCNRHEPLKLATPFDAGKTFEVGSLSIESRLTRGHSPGGTSYIIAGLERLVAVVGDALFCYSQGGATASAYREALENNRSQILSLPADTVICPGHGPVTTVREELAYNPFYA